MAKETEQTGIFRISQTCMVILPLATAAILISFYVMGIDDAPLAGLPSPIGRGLPNVTRRFTATKSVAASKTVPKDAGPLNVVVTLLSPPKDSIKVGGMLHYRITCLHKDGTMLDRGGGFWYAVLGSRAKPKASTAGRVVDHNNGSYSIFAQVGWAGDATLSVTRVLNSEGVDFMNNTIWPADDRVVWQGFFKAPGANPKRLPSTICRLRNHGDWSNKCVYGNEKALGKTAFICEKPKGINCKCLYSTKSVKALISARIRQLCKGNEDLLKRARLHPDIKIEDPVVHVHGPPEVSNPKLPECHADQELPVSDGFWFENRWKSNYCKITDYTDKTNLTSCLRHKDLQLFGDSTTRQWFVHIMELLERKFQKGPDDLNFYWRRHFDDLDTSILISFPKQLVGSATVLMNEVFYEVDLIDKLNDTRCNYILMVSPWAHFSQWTRESYVERTERLREALIRFRQRCPEVKIALKSPHPRDQKNFDAFIYGSDYILKGIEEINQRLLGGIGVWQIPIWDLNLANENKNTIHMPVSVIHEEVKMFFSYVCGDAKVPPLKVSAR